ncbi:MAG: glycine/sarcosine/betaine reductase selenoprotein B family protein [Ktedonobacteraceae bacterium]
MQKHARLTPTSRLRERLARWVNDTALGEHTARWIARVPGVLQLRLKVKLSNKIPWTPLRRPLAEATVAIVATGGVHCCADRPFNLKTDASFRAIPRSATTEDLCISHDRYDRRDAERDLNLVFPLERLLELEAEGVIGRVAEAHYGFGHTDDPQELVAPGRKVADLLAETHVDLVLLVPA